MKLSLIQMNSGQEKEANVARACQFIDKAAKDKPDLIVLPEFFNTVYFGQYRDYRYVAWAEPDDGSTMTRIKDKARQHGVHIIATIYEEEAPGVYYDTAMVIDPQGQIVGKYRKTHPAAFRSLEKIYFRYGSKYPVFRIHDWRVGMVICYDLFFPESARCLAVNGAELIIVPFCEPVGFLTEVSTNIPAISGEKAIDKAAWLDSWRVRMRMRAIENVTYLAACNHAGREDQVVYAGGSCIVDPKGNMIVEAGEEEKILTASLDRELFVGTRQNVPLLRDRRPDLYKSVCTETDDLALC